MGDFTGREQKDMGASDRLKEQAEYKNQPDTGNSASNMEHTAITTGMWRIEYNEKGELSQASGQMLFGKFWDTIPDLNFRIHGTPGVTGSIRTTSLL